MASYGTSVLRVGWRTYENRIGGGRRQVIAFIMQAAVLFAFLYFAPWFGDFVAESRLVAASVLAILGSGFLTLIWDIARVPKNMNDMAKKRVSDLRKLLLLNADADKLKARMLDLCKEGRALVARSAPRSDVDEWKA
jgi:hypothetical protein